MVQVLTNEDIFKLAPSAFAVEGYNVHEKFNVFPTIELINTLRKEGFQPIKAGQRKSKDPEKHATTRHVIRFRHQNNIEAETKEEIPEIVLVNANDRTSAYKLFSGIFRVVCTNGLVVQSEEIHNISIPHRGKLNVIDNVITASYEVLNVSDTVFGKIDEMKQIPLTFGQQETLAGNILEELGKTTTDATKYLEARRSEDKGSFNERDAWKTFNVIQENIIRGGVSGVTPNGRKRTTHGVKNIVSDLEINRKIWKATENFLIAA